MRKLFSLVLSLSLTVSATSFTAIGAPSAISFIQPPSVLGQVTEHFEGAPGKRVILIQDLHAHLETQKKIAALLGFYQAHGLLRRPVAVEGASGVWDLRGLASFPDSKKKRRLYDYLLAQAGIAGPDWYALTTHQPRLLYGVESFEDFNGQRELFTRTRPARELVASQLEAAARALAVLEKREFSGRVRRWEKLTDRFDRGDLDDAAYIGKLKRLANRASVSVGAAPVEGPGMSSGALDVDAAAFGQRVGAALTADNSQKNLIKSLYAARLLAKLLRQQVTFREAQLLSAHETENASLIRELITASGQAVWFDQASLVDLVRASVDFYVAALVRDEPLAVNTLALLNEPANRGTGETAIGRVGESENRGIGEPSDLDKNYHSPNLRFSDSPVHEAVVVLVAGGFHTPGITRTLKARGVSYDVVTPNIQTPYTEADEARYAARASGEPVSLAGLARTAPDPGSGEAPRATFHTFWPRNPEPIDPEDISMLGPGAVTWFAQYLKQLPTAEISRNYQIVSPLTEHAIHTLGWTAKELLAYYPTARGAAPHWLSNGFIQLTAYPGTRSVLSQLSSVQLVEGEMSTEALERVCQLQGVSKNATVDSLAGQFIYRARLQPRKYAIFAHRSTIAPYDALVAEIPDLQRIFAFTLADHEVTEGNLSATIASAPRAEVTHQDLVNYGTTWESIVAALASGRETPYLKDTAPLIGINFSKLSEELRTRHPGLRRWYENVAASVITDAGEIALGRALIHNGQEQLFEKWSAPGSSDDGKKRGLMAQLHELDQAYPGGLVAYLKNVRGIISAQEKGQSRFQGKMPLLPPVIDIPDLEGAASPASEYRRLESLGISKMHKAAVVLVAGGLGKRLGYPGIKIGIPLSLVAGITYFDWLVKNILAFQRRSNALAGTHDRIPLLIIVSDETEEATLAMLKERGYVLNPHAKSVGGETYWENGDSEIILAKQGLAAVVDKSALIQLDPKDPYKVLAQPHGHGDVHILINQLGLAEKWKNAGIEHVLFVQDTNGQSPNALPVAVGATEERHAGMTFVAVPRRPNDPVGLLVSAADEKAAQQVLQRHGILFDASSGANLFDVLESHGISPDEFRKEVEKSAPAPVLNVEYVVANNALKSTVDSRGDAARSGAHTSPYPGNINVLDISLAPYLKALQRTGGLMPEIINFAKGPSRSETNMQDIAESIGAVQAVRFANRNGNVFSTTKNSLEGGVAAQAKGNAAETASRAESDFYASMRRRLALGGVRVNVDGRPITVKGVHILDGAKVVLMPNFAALASDVVEKIHGGEVSDASTLVIDGENIHVENLFLDGVLRVKVANGARLDIQNFHEINAARNAVKEVSFSEDPAIAVRGYRYEEVNPSAARIIGIYEPGRYRLGASGRLEKAEGNTWREVPDIVGRPALASAVGSEGSLRHSRPRVRWTMAALGFLTVGAVAAAIALGAIESVPAILLAGVLTALWSVPQMLKIFGRGGASYSARRGFITGADSLMMRLEEIAHVGNGRADEVSASRIDEIRDEILVQFVLTPMVYWLGVFYSLRGFVSGLLSRARSFKGPEGEIMEGRIAQLRAYERSGRTEVPLITGRQVRDGVNALSAPSHVFGQIFAFLGTVKESRRRQAYAAARGRLDALIAA